MTALERAIRDAHSAGWRNDLDATNWRANSKQLLIDEGSIPLSAILLDPAFWQALGRARGWLFEAHGTSTVRQYGTDTWKMEWHRLIDDLAAGKSIESFFEQLT